VIEWTFFSAQLDPVLSVSFDGAKVIHILKLLLCLNCSRDWSRIWCKINADIFPESTVLQIFSRMGITKLTIVRTNLCDLVIEKKSCMTVEEPGIESILLIGSLKHYHTLWALNNHMLLETSSTGLEGYECYCWCYMLHDVPTEQKYAYNHLPSAFICSRYDRLCTTLRDTLLITRLVCIPFKEHFLVKQ
jgi:hypothetical protein